MRRKYVDIVCDECGRTLQTPHSTFKEAEEYARKFGWLTSHHPKYDSDLDLCPRCKEKALKEAMKGRDEYLIAMGL